MQSVLRQSRHLLVTPSSRTVTKSFLIAVPASAFVALCAHISVPLPVTPVPITLQNFAVVFLGMALGPVTGCLALVLYLAEGLVGLPVFSPHGLGGAAQLFGPTGGYLLSYPMAAFVAGLVVRSMRGVRSRVAVGFAGAFLGTLPIFLLGIVWLAMLLHLSANAAWALAAAPFLLGEVLKVTAAAVLFAAIQRAREA